MGADRNKKSVEASGRRGGADTRGKMLDRLCVSDKKIKNEWLIMRPMREGLPGCKDTSITHSQKVP
jgi:hypothetical protein